MLTRFRGSRRDALDGDLHVFRWHSHHGGRPGRGSAGQPVHHLGNAVTPAGVRAHPEQRHEPGARQLRDGQREQSRLHTGGGGAGPGGLWWGRRHGDHAQRQRHPQRERRCRRQRVDHSRHGSAAGRGRRVLAMPVIRGRRDDSLLSERRIESVRLSRHRRGHAIWVPACRPQLPGAHRGRFLRVASGTRRQPLSGHIRGESEPHHQRVLLPGWRGLRLAGGLRQQRGARQQ